MQTPERLGPDLRRIEAGVARGGWGGWGMIVVGPLLTGLRLNAVLFGPSLMLLRAGTSATSGLRVVILYYEEFEIAPLALASSCDLRYPTALGWRIKFIMPRTAGVLSTITASNGEVLQWQKQ